MGVILCAGVLGSIDDDGDDTMMIKKRRVAGIPLGGERKQEGQEPTVKKTEGGASKELPS